jgi:hypothetical protein
VDLSYRIPRFLDDGRAKEHAGKEVLRQGHITSGIAYYKFW